MNSMDQLSDWLNHIESFHPSEIELGLERIRQVADKLNLLSISEPIAKKVILVTGTNGKGSCVAMLESLSLTQAKRVGCYTSPHLLKFNERIRINGQNISDDLLVDAFKKIEQQRGDITLTFFEFTTLAAFYLFKNTPLDIVILEIGLGGRHDATNIIEPDVSVITTVDIDHVSWLGHDLESIAFEKGGIIRAGKICFSGDPRTYSLLNKVLPEFKNEIQLISRANDSTLELLNNSSINRFHLLEQNIMLAINAFNHCFNLDLSTQDISLGLSEITLNGRFQKLDTKLITIVDVAHNPQAALNLKRQLHEYKKQNNIVHVSVICGMMADKAINEVLNIMAPVVDQWCFVDLDLARAIKAEGLQKIYKECLLDGKQEPKSNRCFKSVKQAHQWIIQSAGSEAINPNQLILVFGSFITVANMLQYSHEVV